MHQDYPSDPDKYFIKNLELLVTSKRKDNFIKKVEYLNKKEKLNTVLKNNELYQIIEDDNNYKAIIIYLELYILGSTTINDLDKVNLKMIDFWEQENEGIYDVPTENLLTPVFFQLQNAVIRSLVNFIADTYKISSRVFEFNSSAGTDLLKGVAGLVASAAGGYKMGIGFASQDGSEFLKGAALTGGSILSDYINLNGNNLPSQEEWNMTLVTIRDEVSNKIDSLIRANAILVKLDVPFNFTRISKLNDYTKLFAKAFNLRIDAITPLQDVWEFLEEKLPGKYDINQLLEGVDEKAIYYQDSYFLSDDFDVSQFNKNADTIRIYDSLINRYACIDVQKADPLISVGHLHTPKGNNPVNEYLLDVNSLTEEIFDSILKKDFSNPKFKEAKSNSNQQSNCFVVTATFPNNVGIIDDYRNYRDTSLRKTVIGKAFIKLYYKIGPFFASLIKHHPKLKSISKKILLIIHGYIKK